MTEDTSEKIKQLEEHVKGHHEIAQRHVRKLKELEERVERLENKAHTH